MVKYVPWYSADAVDWVLFFIELSLTTQLRIDYPDLKGPLLALVYMPDIAGSERIVKLLDTLSIEEWKEIENRDVAVIKLGNLEKDDLIEALTRLYEVQREVLKLDPSYGSEKLNFRETLDYIMHTHRHGTLKDFLKHFFSYLEKDLEIVFIPKEKGDSISNEPIWELADWLIDEIPDLMINSCLSNLGIYIGGEKP